MAVTNNKAAAASRYKPAAAPQESAKKLEAAINSYNRAMALVKQALTRTQQNANVIIQSRMSEDLKLLQLAGLTTKLTKANAALK